MAVPWDHHLTVSGAQPIPVEVFKGFWDRIVGEKWVEYAWDFISWTICVAQVITYFPTSSSARGWFCIASKRPLLGAGVIHRPDRVAEPVLDRVLLILKTKNMKALPLKPCSSISFPCTSSNPNLLEPARELKLEKGYLREEWNLLKARRKYLERKESGQKIKGKGQWRR